MLRRGLQCCSDALFARASRVVAQALGQDVRNVRLGRQECRPEEAQWQTLAASRATRLRDAPPQDLPKLGIYLPSPLNRVEVHAVPRLLKRGCAALAKLLSHAPDAL